MPRGRSCHEQELAEEGGARTDRASTFADALDAGRTLLHTRLMTRRGAPSPPLVLSGLTLILAGLARVAAADTLYLQSGDRVEGTLVGVRGSSIEFEERDRGRAQLRRFERHEVRRIEIDDRGGSGSSGDDDRDNSGGFASGSSGLRERTVSVSASVAWTDTGIEVRRGQEIQIRASGKVRWGPSRSDGPNGEGGNHYNAARPLPDRPAASLIGRTGDRDDVFFIGGENARIRVREGGRLYLGVNDDYLQDNSGSFRVTVYY